MATTTTEAASPFEAAAARYFARLAQAIATIDPAQLDGALRLLLEADAAHRRVYVMGNGGSAATAGHFVCDLAKTASVGGRHGLRVHALTDNVASLTAWANDSAYEAAFAAQIKGYVEPGDVVIAISASGNSPNIVAGLEEALRQGAQTIAIVGFDGGTACELGKVVLHVRSDDYGCVEDAHAAIGHALTNGLRDAFAYEFGDRS